MTSKILHVRLTADEWAMLQRIRVSEVEGERNASEIIRLLLHREYQRRTTKCSVVASSAIASDFRSGRPPGPAKQLAEPVPEPV